jgi:thioredoxin-related protein
MSIKYILLVFSFLLISSSNTSAQNKIKWYTWKEAVEKSSKTKKKIFVDIYTDWCGWCKKLDNTTFAQDHIAKYINENFYAVKFDAEMKEAVSIRGTEYNFVNSGTRGYHELAAYIMQGRMSYPTVAFLDEDMNLIQAIPGFQDVPTFEMIITYFGSNNHKSTPWNKYMAQYNKDQYFKK